MGGSEMSTHRPSGTPSETRSSLWRNRNFLRFFFGQFVSNAGDSLYTVAILWFVYELSGSTALTGIANSLLLLPFVLQIIAGPIVDRLPIKPLLVGSQVVQGVVVLVLPLAAYTGQLTVELIIVLIPALSLMTLVNAPIQSTLVPRIVADEQLSRSNSALATVTLGLDMVFDALGGLLIAVFGATALFLADSLTFAVAGVLFTGMMIPSVDSENEAPAESALTAYVSDLRSGIDILRGTLFVEMMFTTAVSNFAIGVALAVLPAFGTDLGGPAIYGLLLGAIGIGRMFGSVTAPSLNDVPYGRLTAVSFLLSALLWVGSVYSPSVVLTIGLFCLAWVAAGVNGVLMSTLNQRVFPKNLLGRISAIKGTASMATLPVGSLVGGFVAEYIGVLTTMGLAAFGFGFVGLYFAVRPGLRHLPAVADVGPSTFDIRVDSSQGTDTLDGGEVRK